MTAVVRQREISLTQGQTALVDSADVSSVSQHKWGLVRSGSRKHMYAATTIAGRRVYLHRFLLDPPQDMVVDHINRDGLDNRRENLRICTRGQNTRNRCANHTKAGFKGVHRYSAGFFARINQEYLGSFDTAVEAAAAYNAAALKRHGEFAHLNDIPATEYRASLLRRADRLRTALADVLTTLEGLK